MVIDELFFIGPDTVQVSNSSDHLQKKKMLVMMKPKAKSPPKLLLLYLNFLCSVLLFLCYMCGLEKSLSSMWLLIELLFQLDALHNLSSTRAFYKIEPENLGHYVAERLDASTSDLFTYPIKNSPRFTRISIFYFPSHLW